MSLSYGVDQQLLHCLKGGVAILETAHGGGEDFHQ